MNDHVDRPWDAGWAKLDTTITEQDVWLLTDHIKLRYLLPHVRPGMKALEVGCGSAKLSALLAQQGVLSTGLDRSPQALRVARNNFDRIGASGEFLEGDAFKLPFTDARFDLVFSTGLLEHFASPLPIVAEMTRVLQPGGLFFSDVAPLKFSLLRAGLFLRGLHRSVRDEYRFSGPDILGWLNNSGLEDARVFSSGVVPPLVVIRRIGLARRLSFRFEKAWTVFDGSAIGDRLGFFYLAFGRKPGGPRALAGRTIQESS